MKTVKPMRGAAEKRKPSRAGAIPWETITFEPGDNEILAESIIGEHIRLMRDGLRNLEHHVADSLKELKEIGHRLFE